MVSQLPSSKRRVGRLPAELGSSPWGRNGRAEWRSWRRSRHGRNRPSASRPLRASGAVEAGAAGRDAPLRRHAGHLGEHQAGAAFGALGVVHEVPVVRRAVDRAVLRHRRDADAVGDLHAAHAERHEHRRARGVRPMAGGLLLEPFLGAGQPVRIALAQVLVADALRARQQRIVELHRIEMEIALDILEPFGRIARRSSAAAALPVRRSSS